MRFFITLRLRNVITLRLQNALFGEVAGKALSRCRKEQNLSAPRHRPSSWERGQGAAGRPPLGPGCATAPRAPAGDERVASGGTAGHARAATLPDDGPSVAVGQGSATAHPLKGRAATASSMGPRLIWELPLGHRGRGMPAAASLPPAQATNPLTADAVRQRCPARQRGPNRDVREFLHPHATATPTAPSRTPPCLPYGRWSSHP